MGTNYFIFTRSKRLAHTHFATKTDWGVIDEEYAQKERDAVRRFHAEGSIWRDLEELYS